MDFEKILHNSDILMEVSISKEKSNQIKKFVKEVIKKKNGEEHHIVDNGNEFKRWYTGFSGEACIEKMLNSEFTDLSIGDSENYHVSDLSKLKLDIGVKTVEYGKFPIIIKNNDKHEIIVIKKNDLDFIVCGIATPKILNSYQSDDLILSPNLRERGTKSGFYGLDKLIKFSTIEDLSNITSHYPNDSIFRVDGVEYLINYNDYEYNITNLNTSQEIKTINLLKVNRKIKKYDEIGKLKWVRFKGINII